MRSSLVYVSDRTIIVQFSVSMEILDSIRDRIRLLDKSHVEILNVRHRWVSRKVDKSETQFVSLDKQKSEMKTTILFVSLY